jgi:hypothetical protein
VADLQCRLQEAVDANREVLNARGEERRTKAEITASRQQQAETAQAQHGTAAKPSAGEQPAKASKGIPSAGGSERSKTSQQQQLEDASRRKGIARLWSDQEELSFRRSDGYQLEPLYVCSNIPTAYSVEGAAVGDLETYRVAVYSGETGLIAEFQPYQLSAIAALAEQQVAGSEAAIEAHVNSYGDDTIVLQSVVYQQRGTLYLDSAFSFDNTLCLLFVRQRWVRYTAQYTWTTYFNGNPLNSFATYAYGMPSLVGQLLCVTINLESKALIHSVFELQSRSISSVTAAQYGGNPAAWTFHYQTQETIHDPRDFLAQATGLDAVFSSCAPGLFSSGLSKTYDLTFDASTQWYALLPYTQSLDLQFAEGSGYVGPLLGVSLLSDPQRRYREEALFDRPRWQGLWTSEAVRVIGAPLEAGGVEEVLEISEYQLDLSDCVQVNWLDQYWPGSFDGLGDELAPTGDVFLQEAIPVADDPLQPSGVWLNAIANDAPVDPYAAVYAVNAPLRQANTLSLGLSVRQIVYRASNG